MSSHAAPAARIQVRLIEGPLPRAASGELEPACGAVVEFLGVVRPTESGRPLAALVYESYEPMTSRELLRLAERIAVRHGARAIGLEHSIGRVAVGGVSFRLRVATPHRAEGLAAVAELIDEMKRSVPLWKMPEFADG